VFGNQVLLGYLLVSAICSTVAFALFEVSTIFQLHDLMTLDSSIKAEIGVEKLIKRGYFVLAVSSLINFLSILYFLALAWHMGTGAGTKFPLDDLPQPWNWLYYAVHASAYTAVLFLAGIFGERSESGKEEILATQRALEQQALERLKLQKEAQIEQMMRAGVPLGAVAAASAIFGPRRRSIVSSIPTTSGPVGANVVTSSPSRMRLTPRLDQTARLSTRWYDWKVRRRLTPTTRRAELTRRRPGVRIAQTMRPATGRHVRLENKRAKGASSAMMSGDRSSLEPPPIGVGMVLAYPTPTVPAIG